MSSSVMSSLTSLLDGSAVSKMAARLRQSPDSVSRGLGQTFAVILSGMATKINERGGSRQLYDLVAGVPADCLTTKSMSDLASGDMQAAPLVNEGRQLMTMLFGVRQGDVEAAVAETSRLSTGTAAELMALAAAMVLGVLAKRLRTEGRGFAGFTNLLLREGEDVKEHLAAGLSSHVSSSATKVIRSMHAAVESPDEPVRKSSPSWLLAVLTASCLIFGAIWHFQKTSNQRESTSATSRARAAIPGLGEFVDRQLPGNVRLNVPKNGVESRLLSLIQDGQISDKPWLDFDRLSFDTSSAILRPESEEQLQNIASIMNAYPSLRLKIGGYTDNTGSSRSNMRLSQNRADAVTRELISMGVAENRLEGEGYGEQHPIADNSTEEGRAKNRRISMRVLQK